jgi:hypothetical protein
MRKMSLASAAVACGLLLSLTPGKAQSVYPWCAHYADQGRICSVLAPNQCRVPVSGTVNCGFLTLQQCTAALSGNGGSCQLNPLFRPAPRL